MIINPPPVTIKGIEIREVWEWGIEASKTVFFPECVARVPVSLWGLGVEAVFARRCATERSREGLMAVPIASFATMVTFGGFRRRVASFRVAGVALCDIPTCFITCQHLKVVLCGKRNTSASFQEDELHVSWQAQHFGDLHRSFAWQAQHFRRAWQAQHFRRVVLLFFADRMLGLRQVARQVQFPGQALHFARCDEN